MRSNLTAKGVKVEKNFSSLPSLNVDADRLMQVFINLITNSLDALVAAPGKIIWITTRYNAADKLIKVHVKDSGAGIRREVVDRIFEPFFTTKQAENGTGLGLSIVYGIIKDFGGDIEVASEEGKYTEFVIALPMINRMKTDYTI